MIAARPARGLSSDARELLLLIVGAWADQAAPRL